MNEEQKVPKINDVKNRILFLSPTVKNCLERESNKDDFYAESDKPIGKGGFGQVWKVRNKITKNLYAIKVISKKTIVSLNLLDQINREIEIMYKLHHSYIVKLINHYEDDDNIYLIMDFAAKGQLYNILEKVGKFDERTAAQYMREIICAVKYLHQFKPPIIHRDIKPENILIDDQGVVKLCDFGWSNYASEDTLRTSYCGTPAYLPPEIVNKEGHDTSVDIWYLGILLFELLIGYTPFEGIDQKELFNNIKIHRINWPSDIPSMAKNLISKILKHNPKERLTLDEILAHPWFIHNPPLRPVINEVINDPKAILESHLVNVLPEKISDSLMINVINECRPSRIKDSPNMNGNKFQGDNSQILSVLSSENIKIMKKLESKNEIIEKLEKNIYEYKKNLSKSENENNSLKLENRELLKTKQSLETELNRYKEENLKFQLLNKSRLNLLSEVEEKNSEIISLKNKIALSENEIEVLNSNSKNLNDRISRYLSQIETFEKKNEELNTEIEELNKEKMMIISNYEKRINITETNFFKNVESKSMNSDRVFQLIQESLNEIREIINMKISKIEKWITSQFEIENSFEKKFCELINLRSDSLNNILQMFKGEFYFGMNQLKNKLEDDLNLKVGERTKWLKNQVQELIPFKNKYIILENENEKLKRLYAIAKENLHSIKSLNEVNEKLLLETKNQLNYKNDYNLKLETKIKKVKEFLNFINTENSDYSEQISQLNL